MGQGEWHDREELCQMKTFWIYFHENVLKKEYLALMQDTNILLISYVIFKKKTHKKPVLGTLWSSHGFLISCGSIIMLM